MDDLESFLQDFQAFSFGDGMDDDQLELVVARALADDGANAGNAHGDNLVPIMQGGQQQGAEHDPQGAHVHGDFEMERSLNEIIEGLEQKMAVFDAHLLALERKTEEVQRLLQKLVAMTERSYHNARLVQRINPSWSHDSSRAPSNTPSGRHVNTVPPTSNNPGVWKGQHADGAGPSRGTSVSEKAEGVASAAYFDKALFDVVAPDSLEHGFPDLPTREGTSNTAKQALTVAGEILPTSKDVRFCQGIPKMSSMSSTMGPPSSVVRHAKHMLSFN
ncbi:hypothetical protein PIB30_078519 [Stylosanthes scabra]|uniref:Uncharacterized protein n=1 Tax=Stylosanthes scabra TaxID=79078 RepID=A0ABU6RQY2_9FABA|nr:hypothetical protein [Stylosanthes scabra]